MTLNLCAPPSALVLGIEFLRGVKWGKMSLLGASKSKGTKPEPIGFVRLHSFLINVGSGPDRKSSKVSVDLLIVPPAAISRCNVFFDLISGVLESYEPKETPPASPSSIAQAIDFWTCSNLATAFPDLSVPRCDDVVTTPSFSRGSPPTRSFTLG